METVGALGLIFFAVFSLSLCREKDVRVRRAACSNCSHSLDNRGGWFGGDRFYLRESYEQLLDLALFVWLGQGRLGHGSIFARRWAEEKPSFPCTIFEATSVRIFAKYSPLTGRQTV